MSVKKNVADSGVTTREDYTVPTETSIDDDPITVQKTNDLRTAHRKVDYRLLLWYSLVYLIMRIDVGNISNTAIINVEQGSGIERQLGNITSAQWAWALSIFYYPYTFFEPLSTLLVKKYSPSIWMSRIMVTWGIISMCQGATSNYAGILATRFFLGLAEAGFYPGVLYHLSFWYHPDTMPLRIAFFFACGLFSGTISGLLAYAISFMNGAGGLAGWRWVFILEGIPPILCGVISYFFLPNYPETSKFLSKNEETAILDHLPKDAPNMAKKTWDLGQAKALLKNSTFIPFTLLWVSQGIGGYGVTTVLPNVIYALGMKNSAITQLMTIPTYSLAFIQLVVLGFLIRRGRLSPWVVAVGLEIISIIGFIILIVVDNTVVKFVFLTTTTACSVSIYPIVWPERIRAARGTTTAGLAIGITNAAAQMMGIVGPQVYQQKFGPSYHVSYAISIALLVIATACIITCRWLMEKGSKGSESEKDHSGIQVESEDIQ